jgi:hypothetical protein
VTKDVTVAESSIHELGVFATIDFAAGDIILSIDDSREVDDAHPVSPEEGRYRDYLEAGRTILMQIPERYINHSCRPNVFVKTLNGVRHVVALYDIVAGEEIAYDYCVNGYGDTVWDCSCGVAGCRRSIHSDFFHLPLNLQEEYLPLLDEWFRKERAQDIAALEAVLARRSPRTRIAR